MNIHIPSLILLVSSAFCFPLTAAAYFNSLTNPAVFSSDFANYSSGGGTFDIDPAYGLQLTSIAPDAMDGIQAYNNYLSASQDWSVTVRAHLSSFTNNQPNPFYRAGLLFAKLGLDFATTSQNVINLQLERGSASEFGESMSNSVTSTLGVDGVEVSSTIFPVGQTEDVFLRLSYLADGAIVNRSFSTDGTTYSALGSVSLADSWGLTAEDDLVLALVGTALAYDGETPTYSVSAGEIYLKDVNVVPEPTTYALLVLSVGLFVLGRRFQSSRK